MGKTINRLRYNPKNGEYIIEPIPKGSNVADSSKLPNEVMRYSQYIWVCKFKSKLEDYKQKLINEKARRPNDGEEKN